MNINSALNKCVSLFQDHQSKISSDFVAINRTVEENISEWSRQNGGGGKTIILSGDKIEKAAINFSLILDNNIPSSSQAKPLNLKKGDELKLIFPQKKVNPKNLENLKFKYFFLQPMDGPNLKSNIKKTYKIVGKDEADVAKNYIYFRSPIGKALIGKNKKDMITVTTPSGEKNFEIIEIKYI